MSKIGNDIAFASECLLSGELVAIPTETVYGLAGDGTRPEVVSQIFSVKNRPTFDPMILHFREEKDVLPFVKEVPDLGKKLMAHFWPGPLTLLLERTELVPDLVTAGSPKVAVRVPSHPMLLELLGRLPFPLAAPSANPFGYISPTTAQHVADQLGENVAFILDGGPCEVGVESTIVDVTGERSRVLRKGGVDIEAIENLIGPLEVLESSSSRPTAPGMLLSHYAPKTRMKLIEGSKIEFQNPGRVGVLAYDSHWNGVPNENQIVLSRDGDLKEAAQRLFASMRELDGRGYECIYTELVPERGLGRAINDKLRRATVGQQGK